MPVFFLPGGSVQSDSSSANKRKNKQTRCSPACSLEQDAHVDARHTLQAVKTSVAETCRHLCYLSPQAKHLATESKAPTVLRHDWPLPCHRHHCASRNHRATLTPSAPLRPCGAPTCSGQRSGLHVQLRRWRRPQQAYLPGLVPLPLRLAPRRRAAA